jgi:hypothetical protein
MARRPATAGPDGLLFPYPCTTLKGVKTPFRHWAWTRKCWRLHAVMPDRDEQADRAAGSDQGDAREQQQVPAREGERPDRDQPVAVPQARARREASRHAPARS